MPYIGKTTDGFGVRNRFVYLASSGDTSVSGADANGATLTFTDGAYVDVYLNGVLLKPTTDYNTSTANTIAGLSALNTNDEVTVVVYDVFTVGDMVSATSGGTFSGNVTMGGTLGVTGATTTAAITASGIIKTDDTTDATSTTDGSLQTDGGLSVAKDAVIGDDLSLKSDSAVLNFGADNDITITHVADKGLIVSSGSSGATAPTFADELVIDHGSYNGGISILTGGSNNGRICFGDSSDNDVGQINYDHGSDEMKFVAGGITHFGMGAAGNTGTALNANILEAPTSLSMADDTSFNVTLGHNGILLLNDASSGAGGLFYYQYLSGLTELADPSGVTASSDSDGSLCIFKVSTNGNNYTIKNRRGGTKAIGIVSLAHSVG